MISNQTQTSGPIYLYVNELKGIFSVSTIIRFIASHVENYFITIIYY